VRRGSWLRRRDWKLRPLPVRYGNARPDPNPAQRIDAAPVAQLYAWLDGILDAASVEALIGMDTGRAP